ncbi:hypothetical protein DRH14_00305 [Candidatus Shapirobacteria bacterium]|nr:MAG: hypothetical protein DRH14_00305 [Candidatus Shapirobacteria bacterium]
MLSFKHLIKTLSDFGSYWQRKQNRQILKWNFLLIVVQPVLIFYYKNQLPPQVPLFYSLPWGACQLANQSFLFLLPVFSLLVLLFNTLLATFFNIKSLLLSHILNISSLLFAIFSLFALSQIIFLLI